MADQRDLGERDEAVCEEAPRADPGARRSGAGRGGPMRLGGRLRAAARSPAAGRPNCKTPGRAFFSKWTSSLRSSLRRRSRASFVSLRHSPKLTLLLLSAILGAAPAFPVRAGAEEDAEATKPSVVARFSHQSNDLFFDSSDRWRSAHFTGSAVLSFPRFAREGLVPDAVELRLRGEIITPWGRRPRRAPDRLAVAAVGIGAIAHARRAGFDFAYGAELLVHGEQTGLFALQRAVHEITGGGYDIRTSGDPALGDGVSGRIEAALARRIPLGERIRLIPFAEGSLGYESFLRAGADLSVSLLGSPGHLDGIILRDTVSGQPSFVRARERRAVGAKASRASLGLTLGADVAHVSSSIFLDRSGPVTLDPTRVRARGALMARIGRVHVHAGFAWLSPEFREQPQSQTINTFGIGIDF